MSDGTESGTRLVIDLNPGPGAQGYHYGEMVAGAVSGTLLFAGWTVDHGFELWTTDGTSAGTRQITEIGPGLLGSNPSYLAVIGSHLYFTANDNVTGYEPWIADVSDADGDGVLALLDDCPGTVPGASVDLAGCPALIPADFDRDGDVGGDDVLAFAACAAGSAIDLAPECLNRDLDGDGDADSADFAVVQLCLSGDNVPAEPACGG